MDQLLTKVFTFSLEGAVHILLSGLLIYIGLVVFTRMVGLRSYSKMTTFDFALTIATGSVVAAGLLNDSVSVTDTLIGIAVLLGMQWCISTLRLRWGGLGELVTNQPILLVENGKILYENLLSARVTEGELYAKLRESGVRNLQSVEAAIFETTADISVILKKNDENAYDLKMLLGVRK